MMIFLLIVVFVISFCYPFFYTSGFELPLFSLFIYSIISSINNNSALKKLKQEIVRLKIQLESLEPNQHPQEITPEPQADISHAVFTDINASRSTITTNEVDKEEDVLPDTTFNQATDIDDQPDPTVVVPSVAQSTQPNSVTVVFEELSNVVKRYFTDGNLFVRIGILILFAGVAFLLKYTADHTNLPVSFRFILSAIGGLTLIIIGWRLRTKKTTYGLLLQGAGIGITYITVVTAYQLQGLLPPVLAFSFLCIFSITTSILAVLQNSRALAIYAVVGGFAAPILTSSGSNNYVGLFSYYLILDLCIFAIAWFKAWRPLNLVGFSFTFLMMAYWIHNAYQPSDFLSAEILLIAFFIIYSVLSILFSPHKSLDIKNYIDGSLLFGTPIICFGLQVSLVNDISHGITISAMVMSIYYLILGRWLWTKNKQKNHLLAEALVVTSVIFVTIAIPYAIHGQWSSATWAIESAGIIWLGIRQQRKYTVCFAVILQIAAGLLFLARGGFSHYYDGGILNSSLLNGLIIAIAGLISSYQLFKHQQQDKNGIIGKLHPYIFIWALSWWFVSLYLQVNTNAASEYRFFWHLLVLSLSIAGLNFYCLFRKLYWTPAIICSISLVTLLALIAIARLTQMQHALFHPDIIAWVVSLLIAYWVSHNKLIQNQSPQNSTITLFHDKAMVVLLITIAALLSLEIHWVIHTKLPAFGESWRLASLAIPSIVLLFSTAYPTVRKRLTVLHLDDRHIRQPIQVILMGFFIVWSLSNNVFSHGLTAPLNYIPLFNPTGLIHILILLCTTQIFRQSKDEMSMTFQRCIPQISTVLIFIWITSMLLRYFHNYHSIPYQVNALLNDVTVQISISILWTTLGALGMLFASKKNLRSLWIASGGLVGIVLIKMVIFDLSASGTLERIISFLVVGFILVGLGYFSPIPNTEAGDNHD